MGFSEQFSLSQDQAFIRRIQHTIVKTAVAVVSEAGTVNNHASRTTFATAVCRNPEAYANQYSQAVTTNGAITAASSDSDIEFTVNSMWDAFAGKA